MSDPAVKFSVAIQSRPSDDELLFIKQLGVEYVYTWVGADRAGSKSLIELRLRVEDAGLTLYNVANRAVAKSDKIHLALPGRDDKIAEFKSFVRNLGRARIHTTTFTWEPTQVWNSGVSETRGARCRRVDLDEMLDRPFTHGRAYSEDEIWDSFAYFMGEIIPVAEEAGVRLALHPNDPPVPVLGGIPSLIHSIESYERAFEIAGSPNLGMEFCTGCWLEGGEAFGDMLQAIRRFNDEGRILIVHFRNVSSPLPRFVETFLDNGYMDMYEVMRTFVEIGYQGTLTLDHTPKLARGSGRDAETAYALGYMRALMERAVAETGLGEQRRSEERRDESQG